MQEFVLDTSSSFYIGSISFESELLYRALTGVSFVIDMDGYNSNFPERTRLVLLAKLDPIRSVFISVTEFVNRPILSQDAALLRLIWLIFRTTRLKLPLLVASWILLGNARAQMSVIAYTACSACSASAENWLSFLTTPFEQSKFAQISSTRAYEMETFAFSTSAILALLIQAKENSHRHLAI